MGDLKTNSAKMPNMELIETYYRGGRLPFKNQTSTLTQLKFLLSHKPVLSLTIFLLFIICGAIISYYLIISHSYINKNVALSPSKYYGTTLYYNYKGLKNKIVSLRVTSGDLCAAINFDRSIDLRDSIISFTAKGENGAEKIAVILRDKNNISNANLADIILTPALSKNRWQVFNINPVLLNVSVDKSNIAQIRFDISLNLTENKSSAAVYIKDICISHKRCFGNQKGLPKLAA